MRPLAGGPEHHSPQSLPVQHWILGSVGKKQIVFSQLHPDRDQEAPLPLHRTEEILYKRGKRETLRPPVSQATQKEDSGHRCCAMPGQAGPGTRSAHGALTGRTVRSRQTPPRPTRSLHCQSSAFTAPCGPGLLGPCLVGQSRPGSHLPPACSLRSFLPCATSQLPHRPQPRRPSVTPQTPGLEAHGHSKHPSPGSPAPFSGLRVNRPLPGFILRGGPL